MAVGAAAISHGQAVLGVAAGYQTLALAVSFWVFKQLLSLGSSSIFGMRSIKINARASTHRKAIAAVMDAATEAAIISQALVTFSADRLYASITKYEVRELIIAKCTRYSGNEISPRNTEILLEKNAIADFEV